VSGIFVTRGMSLRIPKGGLSIGIGSEGDVNSSVRCEVLLDMASYWYEIGLRHVTEASLARQELLIAVENQSDEAKGAALEKEFTAGMQAVVASATALDALYASVSDRFDVPDSLLLQWRQNRTARPAQVAEVFRQAFSVKNAGFTNLKLVIGKVYRFRDLAAHPPGKFSEPLLHPILNVGVEWRFVSFGFESALNALHGSLGIAVQLADMPRSGNKAFEEYCAGLSLRLKPIAERWEAQFGELLGDTSAAGVEDV